MLVFQNAIANASSLAEVERLKGMLQAGQIPGRDVKQGSVVVEEEDEEEEEVGPAQTEAHMGGTSEEEIMKMDQGEDDKNMETGSHVNGS